MTLEEMLKVLLAFVLSFLKRMRKNPAGGYLRECDRIRVWKVLKMIMQTKELLRFWKKWF